MILYLSVFIALLCGVHRTCTISVDLYIRSIRIFHLWAGSKRYIVAPILCRVKLTTWLRSRHQHPSAKNSVYVRVIYTERTIFTGCVWTLDDHCLWRRVSKIFAVETSRFIYFEYYYIGLFRHAVKPSQKAPLDETARYLILR